MAKKLYSHNAEHEKRRRVSIPKEPILDQPDGFTKESLTVTMASVRKALDFAGIQNTGIQAGIRDGSIVWLANIKTDDGSPRTFSGQIPFVDGMNIRRNLRYKDHSNFRPKPTFKAAISMTSPVPEKDR